MICLDCKAQKHRGCKGGTWCDCQHRGNDFYEEDEFVGELMTRIRAAEARGDVGVTTKPRDADA